MTGLLGVSLPFRYGAINSAGPNGKAIEDQIIQEFLDVSGTAEDYPDEPAIYSAVVLWNPRQPRDHDMYGITADVMHSYVVYVQQSKVYRKVAGIWSGEQLPGEFFGLTPNRDSTRETKFLTLSYSRFILDVHEAELQQVRGPAAIVQSCEEVATFWSLFGEQLAATVDDQIIGDALARMLAQVVKVEDPPRGPLKAALSWFAHKADVFLENAAESAGKFAGPPIVAAVTYGAAKYTGTWEELSTLVHKALKAVGE
jgi:hypothetical protein